MGISLPKTPASPHFPEKMAMFPEHILTFLDMVAYRHMHACVKTKCSSGAHKFRVRRIEKGHELARDCELAQKIGMKVPAHHSPKLSGNGPSFAGKL